MLFDASSGYTWDWTVIFTPDALTSFGRGVEMTLLISLLSLTFGTIVGLVAALLRVYSPPVVGRIVYIYVDFFRTTPALVQLIWVFYALPILLNIQLPILMAGILTLSLNAGAFLSEIFRGGIESIAPGQRDAAHVLGLGTLKTLRYVILPQALRRVLPATANVFISLIKDSSLLSVIAISELTYMTQTAVARTFRPLEFYTAVAVIYFAITYPLSLGSKALERRFRVT